MMWDTSPEPASLNGDKPSLAGVSGIVLEPPEGFEPEDWTFDEDDLR